MSSIDRCNSLELLLDRLGITSHHGTPNHPQTQGKVERVHQTMKKALAARPLPVDVDELNDYLGQFRDYYNHRVADSRPHRALDRATPAAAYEDLPKATPMHATASRHDRLRVDRVHSGKITLRYEGVLRKLYVGTRHDGRAVLVVCLGPEVTVVDKDTAVILATFHIDTTKVVRPGFNGG